MSLSHDALAAIPVLATSGRCLMLMLMLTPPACHYGQAVELQMPGQFDTSNPISSMWYIGEPSCLHV